MGIHFGVDYYPEHWPRARWETDARLMKEMGVPVSYTHLTLPTTERV